MKIRSFLTALCISHSALAAISPSEQALQGEWLCKIPYDGGKVMDYFSQDLRPNGEMVTTGSTVIQEKLNYEYTQVGSWSVKDDMLSIRSNQHSFVRMHSKQMEKLLHEDAQLRQAENAMFESLKQGSDLSQSLSLHILDLTQNEMMFSQKSNDNKITAIGRCRKR